MTHIEEDRKPGWIDRIATPRPQHLLEPIELGKECLSVQETEHPVNSIEELCARVRCEREVSDSRTRGTYAVDRAEHLFRSREQRVDAVIDLLDALIELRLREAQVESEDGAGRRARVDDPRREDRSPPGGEFRVRLGGRDSGRFARELEDEVVEDAERVGRRFVLDGPPFVDHGSEEGR